MKFIAIKSVISDKISELKILEKTLERACPSISGELSVRKCCGTFRYYIRNNTEKTGKYLGMENKDRIKELEFKNYCRKLLAVSRNEIFTLEKILRFLDGMSDPENVFYSIEECKRHLINPYIYQRESFEIEKWKQKNIFIRKLIQTQCSLQKTV